MGRWRERSPKTLGAPFGAQGLGSFIRETQDDTPITPRKWDWAQPIFAVRMSLTQALLPCFGWPLQKGISWLVLTLWPNLSVLFVGDVDKKRRASRLVVRPTALEWVLLRSSSQEPQLWSNVWKPYMRAGEITWHCTQKTWAKHWTWHIPDPLGQKCRGTCQVGQRSHRLSLDRRNHDPAKGGRLDPPFG